MLITRRRLFRADALYEALFCCPSSQPGTRSSGYSAQAPSPAAPCGRATFSSVTSAHLSPCVWHRQGAYALGHGCGHRHMATKRKQAPPPQQLKPLDLRINQQIRTPTVRLVVGDSHEVVSLPAALARAAEQGLDLVEVAGQVSPPVCKILSFATLQAEHKQSHVDQIAKKKAAVKAIVKDKELRVGCKISEHDLGTKLRQMAEFFEKGYQVTISCTYEFKQKKWQVEYPLAVQTSKSIWDKYSPGLETWFDYNSSGNKQVSILYSKAPAGKGQEKFPWEAGSRPPPFIIRMQQEEAARLAAGGTGPAGGRGRGGRGGGGRR